MIKYWAEVNCICFTWRNSNTLEVLPIVGSFIYTPNSFTHVSHCEEKTSTPRDSEEGNKWSKKAKGTKNESNIATVKEMYSTNEWQPA